MRSICLSADRYGLQIANKKPIDASLSIYDPFYDVQKIFYPNFNANNDGR